MPAEFLADFRNAARALAHSRAFAFAAVATIALGIGVTSGVYTILNGILFRDLPAPDGHELVSVYETVEGIEDRAAPSIGVFSTAEYEIYRDRTRALSGILGHSDPTRTTLGGANPEQIIGLIVTCNYFDVLDQQPMLGRGLSGRDCAPGANPIAVLSHDFWVSRFDSDPTIIGQAIELNRSLVTVVGIAADGTYGGLLYQPAYFAPISAQPAILPNEDGFLNDRTNWLFLLGRRADGVSVDQARAELEVIAAQIDAAEPGRRTTLQVERATPLSIPLFRGAALAVGAVVMTAFALVLCVACMNVSSLMLARATARTRELAIRLSLGARRARIVRLLLAESMLIAVTGGVLGSIAAVWSSRILVSLLIPSITPVGVPRIALDSSPDMHVLLFMLIVIAASGVLSGLVPAMRCSNPNLSSVIKDDAAAATGSRGHGRLRAVLVGAQVAVSVVLMIGAGLLVRGLYATQVVDPGFEYRDVALISYDLRDIGYGADEASLLQQRIFAAVSALPGVERAAFVDQAPLDQGRSQGLVRLPSETQSRLVDVNSVSSGYFGLVEIPILEGRSFASEELGGSTSVAVVTRSTAERYWPGRDPIGQTLLWKQGASEEAALRVVGLAEDAEVSLIGQVDPYYVYLPATPGSLPYLKLLVRGRGDFATTAASVRNALAALDSGIVATITPLESNIDYWRGLSGIVTSVAAALGALALLLATVGIYGIVAYFVTSRFREIGIRVALGAGAPDVLRLVLRRTMRPVVIGAAMGVAASVAMSDVLESMLFGVSPLDAAGLSTAVVLVLAVAGAACLLASRKAVSVDPSAVLHRS